MTYECALCKGTFEFTRSDEDALKEMKGYWGDVPKEDQVVVCHDCFNEIDPDNNPELMAESRRRLKERSEGVSKKFNPKINPGPWELEELKTETQTFYMIADDNLENTNKEHMRAVVAIPELLEVYHAVTEFLNQEGELTNEGAVVFADGVNLLRLNKKILEKVRKAAKEVIDADIVVSKGESYKELDNLCDIIDKLEQAHCDEPDGC